MNRQAALGADTLASSGVPYAGIAVLGAGAIGYSLFGAACAWLGFIHSTELRWIPSVGEGGFNAAWGPVIGYLAMALLFTGMMYYTRNEPVQQLEALPQGE